MLQASVPLMVAVLAHFFFIEEPFRARQFIGIITGMIGILLAWASHCSAPVSAAFGFDWYVAPAVGLQIFFLDGIRPSGPMTTAKPRYPCNSLSIVISPSSSTPSRGRTPRDSRRGLSRRPRIRGSCTSGSGVPDWSLLLRAPAIPHSPGYHHLGGIIKADNPGAAEGVPYNASPHRVRGTLVAVARRPGAGGRS